jgi:hypothetical protein
MLRYISTLLEKIGDWFGHPISQAAFIYGVYASYILYFVAFLGVATIDPSYIHVLEAIMKTYVALFLVVRFNPLVQERPTKLDRQIAYSAGLFLLVTTSIGVLAQTYFKSFVSSSSDVLLKSVSSL